MKSELKAFLKQLRQYGKENDIPNVTDTVGQFLNLLIQAQRPQNILEIGCANGYSTLWMAEAGEKVGAKIHTVDHSAPTFAEAQENIEKAGFSHCVEFHFGDAREVIPNWPESRRFDFIFVDGQKASYLDFWNLVKFRLNPGASLIFDDMLAFPEKTKSFSEAIKGLDGFEQVLLPIDPDDGILWMKSL